MFNYKKMYFAFAPESVQLFDKYKMTKLYNKYKFNGCFQIFKYV